VGRPWGARSGSGPPSLPAYSYTPGEVAWLKSLNGEQTEDGDWIDGDEQARAIDVQSLNATGHWGAGDESGLPVIARWHDVQRAARNIEDRPADRMLEMRVNGATEHQTAQELGMSQSTVHRRVRARLWQIVAELDDPWAVDEDAMPADRRWPPLCWTCHAPAVRLAPTVTERWILAGRIWDAHRGRAVQRWHTRHGDVLTPRPLARAPLGAAFDALFVVGKTQAVERLKFTRRQEEDLLPRDPHVGQWKRATEAAGNGEPPPQMSELPRVSLPVVDVEPERQTHVCEEHLLPELRVRVIRERRWPA
jgi:DNA-directed RNA polymerase specialized sigma24 family protein